MPTTRTRAARCRSARTVASARDAGGPFAAGGRTAAALRRHDWSRTRLGPVDRWPESLKSTLRLMLASPAPSFLWWGPELLALQNDALAELVVGNRPDEESIAQPASEIRAEIWSAIGSEVLRAIAENRAASIPARRVTVKRNGSTQALYLRFRITPISDGDATVGVLGVCEDDTASVLAERRLRALRALAAARPGRGDSVPGERLAGALAGDREDAPFVLVYLADEDGPRARLAGTAGACPKGPAASLPLDAQTHLPAAAAAAVAVGAGLCYVDPFPPEWNAGSSWRGGAALVPLADGGADRPFGFLIVGIPPELPLDEAYRGFLTTAGVFFAEALSSAGSRGAEAHWSARRQGDAASAARPPLRGGPQTAAEPAGPEQQKDQFLAILAHELRTPLAPIRSAVELLSYVDRNPSVLAHAQQVIDRHLTQLVRLIDDLLDAGRLSRGKLELRAAPIDLRGVIAGAVESVRPLIDEAGHDLVVRVPDDPVHVHGDHARLSQVVANVLTNAAQFTADGGHLQLSLESDRDRATVRVTDDGIGIAEDRLPHIFEMFTQGDPPGGRPRRGLGIGLAIARQLVELHGGLIAAASAGKGGGSEFAITLSRLPAASVEAPAPQIDTCRGVSRGRRILVADDNTDAALAIAEVLGMIGHQVRTATDGVEAVDLAERFRPELILLDIGMPRIDGYEACRRIRRSRWGRRIPIYAVTGWGQPSDRRRTREAGFDDHLVKPVSLAAIQHLIAQCAP